MLCEFGKAGGFMFWRLGRRDIRDDPSRNFGITDRLNGGGPPAGDLVVFALKIDLPISDLGVWQ